MSLSSNTKRKLEEALLALDGASAPSTPQTTPSKLFKFTTPRTPLNKTPIAKCSSTSGDNSPIPDPGSLSHYRPWHRQDFLKRLETFKVSTWYSKPKVLNPIECSRYGWTNSAADKLECKMCNARLLCSINESLDAETVEDLGQRYHEQLTLSHNKSCPWRDHPSDYSVYKFPVSTSSNLINGFHERIQALKLIGKEIPVVISDLPEDQIEFIIHSARVDPEEASPSMVKSLVCLSLFGWTNTKIANRHGLKCELCHRKIGLWMFQNYTLEDKNLPSTLPVPVASKVEADAVHPESLDDSNSVKEEELEAFDLVNEHRWYCSWINGNINDSSIEEISVEEKSLDKPGWKQILEALEKPQGRATNGDSPSTLADAGGSSSSTPEKPKDIVSYIRSMLGGSS